MPAIEVNHTLENPAVVARELNNGIQYADVRPAQEFHSPNMEWGPAGEAPQDREYAAQVLGVDPRRLNPIGVLENGRYVIIGWVMTEDHETPFTVRLIPGTTVDYTGLSDPLRDVRADAILRTVKARNLQTGQPMDWFRSEMAMTSTVSIHTAETGHQMTFYWTRFSSKGMPAERGYVPYAPNNQQEPVGQDRQKGTGFGSTKGVPAPRR